MIQIIETPVFTALIRDLLSEDEYRALQLALVLRPEQGTLIRGSGGLRKLRWGVRGRGKRGGIRVIYYWSPVQETTYMLFAFTKTRHADLTSDQLRILRKVVREELK
jgi:hypothetical protein